MRLAVDGVIALQHVVNTALFSSYNKKNYNMIHHIIIGGFIDVYIVVRFVWF